MVHLLCLFQAPTVSYTHTHTHTHTQYTLHTTIQSLSCTCAYCAFTIFTLIITYTPTQTHVDPSPSQRRLHRLGTHVVMPYTTHAAYSCSASAPYVITFTPSFLTYCTTSLCFTTIQQSHSHTHTYTIKGLDFFYEMALLKTQL